MIGTRQILQRRQAVDSIRKMTRTMEMISTTRYKYFLNRWVAAKEYHDALAKAGYLLATSQKLVKHLLMKENSSGHSAILVIGSNRGLCGSYNSYIFDAMKVHLNKAKSTGEKLDIYAPDRRLIGMLNYHGITPVKIYEDMPEMPEDTQIDDITDYFIEQYLSGKLSYFGIVYMRYNSVSSQRAQTLTIMPLTELIDDLTTRATIIWPWTLSVEDFYFSPSVTEIIENLARMIIRSSIKTCFMDAILSEHVSRMVAMKNATENADEMIDELTTEYNRARQGQITGELLDIISGAEVIK
ncbi:MAG: ATP synthase F1 subunit gamma [Sedimentisphaerales bacterium]|jgi:F-type H+-transporting ATPase subunit gamma